MYNIKDKINGFTLTRRRELEEISATLYEFEHDLCGAKLVYFDRDDQNKTFAIAFPTPPTDDTGVFHIIEHSVLCGSEKFPLKDPFAELLKGSLNTFLNAMTYEDRTVYPVSSRCEKDFLNLVDVYLDAVLAPALLKNPSIFGQEGRHFEYDKETDTLTVNGVVYNEMKGAYSSPDELGEMALSKAMYPDTYLGRDSGGNPEAIPSLTYEKFVETYKKHYHPTLSRIILDGRMDLERALSLIDSHLSRFTRGGEYPTFQRSEPRIAPTVKIPFEIPEGEDERGHSRFLFGYGASDYSDKEAMLTATILCDLLTGSNASPLKKALLDKGIAKDAAMYMSKSIESMVVLEVRDTDEDRLEEAEKTVLDVIADLKRNKIDKARLTAVLDNLDFKQREQDFGTLPVGVAYSLAAFGYWMYGSNPEEALLTAEVLKNLRERIDTDYFEDALDNLMGNNPHRATVVMIPDKALAKKNAEKEAERISAIRAKMTDADLENIAKENEALLAWQETDDEDMADTLPKLSLSDITDNSRKIKTTEYIVKGAKSLHQRVKTNGIVYISANFSANDLDKDEILPMSILASTLTNLPTKSREVLKLQSDIKSTFGTFYFSGSVLQGANGTESFLKFFLSALDTKKEEALELATDVLLNTVFDDEKEIMNVLCQAKSQLEDAIVSSGEGVAISRAEAGVCTLGIISEYMSGYEAYKVLKKICADETAARDFIGKVRELYKRLVKRERLTVTYAGEYDESFVDRLVSAIPEEKCDVRRASFAPCTNDREFFVVPSKVAYAAMSGKYEKDERILGFMRVARSILSYEYLWNTIRVKNGAYGAGFIPKRDGTVTFYSYRDPSPAASVKIFAESADYLRDMAKSDCDLTKFIIGAIGEYDILTTPKTEALLSTRDYLTGTPDDFEEKVRRAMLSMTKEDLLICADVIENIARNARIVTVGGGEHLTAFSEDNMTVIEI